MKKLLSVLLLISSLITFVCPISSFAFHTPNITENKTLETTINSEKSEINHSSFSDQLKTLTSKIGDLRKYLYCARIILTDLSILTIIFSPQIAKLLISR